MDFQINIPNPFQGVPEIAGIAGIILMIFIALCVGLTIFSDWIRSIIPNQTRQYIQLVFMVLLFAFIVIAIKNPEYITALF
ncbi:hypothetical protein [Bacillus cereus]|nr:hypothetical protein [Bacillus cereus]ANC11111.1 hypothetical protein WR47_28800 [Bacillus cereus]ANC17125.1 hypothetical protein WR51_29870 [Bacillus cereus]MDA1995942.1 hypothetical protein [Bacillus cereus]MDA2001875.1 hypothetical protein [Bacillus cereus]MDA3654512.1 hypothetical protein [Bacillus cereus]